MMPLTVLSLMEPTPYQIVVPFFSALMIFYAWNLFMRQKKTLWEAALWTIFWFTVAMVAIFPATLQFLSDLTGIKKHENAALFTAIGVLFFMLFYLVIRLEALEQRIVKIGRERALSDAHIDYPKK